MNALDRLADRHTIYRVGAGMALLVVAIGFFRSYYLRAFFRNTSLPLLMQVHGAIMTLWFLLLAVQVSLVRAGRVRMHQRLGIFGAYLAAILCVMAVLITIYSAKQAGDFRPPTPFLGLVLISFIPFPILTGFGIYYRREPRLHRPLMLLASLGILGAALVRFPLSLSENGAAVFMLAGTDALILALVAADLVKHRKLNPAFTAGVGCILFFQATAGVLAPSAAWAQALAFLVARVPGSF